jgi:hypothetical protein
MICKSSFSQIWVHYSLSPSNLLSFCSERLRNTTAFIISEMEYQLFSREKLDREQYSRCLSFHMQKWPSVFKFRDIEISKFQSRNVDISHRDSCHAMRCWNWVTEM